jgi:gamma-glutamyltranspeptidase/glutathione hydrolase
VRSPHNVVKTGRVLRRAPRFLGCVCLAALTLAALVRVSAQAAPTPLNFLAGGAPVREAAFSPDGSRIAMTWDDAIWTMANDGSSAKALVAKSAGWIAERDPAWSPDGKTIAFSADTNGEWDVWTIRADGGTAKKVTSLPGDERWPSYTHDGRIVFSHREPHGAWQLYAKSATGAGQLSKLTPDDASEWQGRVSPDGTRIAFIADRDAGADVSDVWVQDLQRSDTGMSGAHLTRITSVPGVKGYPAWSPDGKRLAYFADRPGPGGGGRGAPAQVAPAAPAAPAAQVPAAPSAAVAGTGVWISIVPPDATGPAEPPVLAAKDAGVPAWFSDGSALLVASFPYARAQYNGDPRRNDDEPPLLVDADVNAYRLNRVDLASGEIAPVGHSVSQRTWTVAFDEVWQTLKSLYYRTGDSAAAWDRARATYRPLIAAATDNHDAEDVLDRMVAGQPLIKAGAHSSNAVITSGNPLASAAGAEIIAKGGNIVDAAIATSFALGVTEPDASTIGGDGMCLLFLKGMAAPIAIDYKDMSIGAPRPASAPRQPDGPSVTNIPGIVAGMDLLYQKYGSHKVAWADLLAPAIRIADEGFILDDALPTTIREGRAQFSKYPESMKVFMPDGRIPKAGDRFVNKDYANTLRIIAKEGGDTFYRGSLAKRIVDDFAANGGLITAEDLAQYHAVERTPLMGHYRGHLVYSAPPPSPTGAQMVETLQILDNYKPKKGATYANDPEFLHYVLDAWRVRGGSTTRIGDPDRTTVDFGDSLTPEHAAERFKLIDPNKAYVGAPGGRGGGVSPSARPSEPAGTYEAENEDGAIQTGTTSFALADADGDMMVFTQTLSTWGGGFYVSKDLGFLYNDHGRGAGQPHTRSSSTTVPTMLFAPAAHASDNAYGIPGFVPKMASGCAGNSWIPASVYNIIINVIDSGMDAQHAIEAPRMLISQRTQIEDRIPRVVLSPLEAMGHAFQKIGRKGEVRQGYASVVIVNVDTHTVEAGAEPRRSHGAVAAGK